MFYFIDMNETGHHTDSTVSRPEFVAELTPYRSLGRTGFLILMLFVAVTCFVSGIMFMMMGAWPILVFFAVDAFIVWLAFRLNYRSGRIRERVSVARDRLVVQKFDPAGRMKEHVFNPFWTRFEVERHEEIGITSMRLRSRNEHLDIGSFLNPDDRESFSTAFAGAIARIRN